MAISLDDVNTLVWRYLNENGFQHSAFLFKSESMVDASDSYVSRIPSGSLISILQKALLYTRLEKEVNKAKKDPTDKNHDIIMQLEEKFVEIELKAPEQTFELFPAGEPFNLRISSSIASILTGHRLCVFSCRWSPDGSMLGTASEDGIAIIWSMRNGIPTDKKVLGQIQDDSSNSTPPPPASTEHAITSVDWGCCGKYFATASLDSVVKIYTSQGILLSSLNSHQHNVFAIAFNPSGNFLVTCSADKTAILWNVSHGNPLHIFHHHTDTIGAVAWRDNNTFATASTDNNIGLCNINGQSQVLRGHTGQVTSIDWNDEQGLLASASEDRTVRIWATDPNALNTLNLASNTSNIVNLNNSVNLNNINNLTTNTNFSANNANTPNFTTNAFNKLSTLNAVNKLHTVNTPNIISTVNSAGTMVTMTAVVVLVGHESEVSCVKWVDKKVNVLVSSSQDGSVRFWDAVRAVCLKKVGHHTLDVITLSVAPNRLFVASAGRDHTVDILRAATGEVVGTFIGSSAVYDVMWDPTSNFLAAGFDDSTVAVIPICSYVK